MAREYLVRPLTGRGLVDGQVVEDQDCGVDELVIKSAEYPVPKVVGHVGRFPGAPIMLTRQVSQADLAGIEAAVSAAYPMAGGGNAKVLAVPRLEESKK